MIKAAIIGCGKIADAHASSIQRIEGCEIVGVCDREELMARQLAERFGVKAHFSDVAALLTKTRPDVVHVTTPPQSHFDIAKQCLEKGIDKVVFDRAGYKYHGRVSALADGAREAGLKF